MEETYSRDYSEVCSVGRDAAERLRSLLEAPIVTVGERVLIGRDVVTAGVVSGRWIELERDLLQGLAASHAWRPSREAVTAGLREFRHRRLLISGEEYAAWLKDRGISQAEVAAAVSRRLARVRMPTAGVEESDLGAAVEALPSEAIYSDALVDCAKWLVDRMLCLTRRMPEMPLAGTAASVAEQERALVASAVVDEPHPSRMARARAVLSASAAYEAEVESVCSRDAIVAHVLRRALDWLRLSVAQFQCSEAGAAAEIAALLREHAAPERIFELSGARAKRQTIYVEDTPQSGRGQLAGARVGAVVGPVAEAGEWRVWRVDGRSAACADDPVVRARACADLVEHRMRELRAGRVKWHGRH